MRAPARAVDVAPQGLDILCVSLEAILPYACYHGVQFALELHNALTAQPDLLQKLLHAFGAEGCWE